MHGKEPKLPDVRSIAWLGLIAVPVNGFSAVGIFYRDSMLVDAQCSHALSEFLFCASNLEPGAAYVPRISRSCNVTVPLSHGNVDAAVAGKPQLLDCFRIDELKLEAVHAQTGPLLRRPLRRRSAPDEQHEKDGHTRDFHGT